MLGVQRVFPGDIRFSSRSAGGVSRACKWPALKGSNTIEGKSQKGPLSRLVVRLFNESSALRRWFRCGSVQLGQTEVRTSVPPSRHSSDKGQPGSLRSSDH